MTKICQGFSVTRVLLKIGGHRVNVGKNGGLSVKVSEKMYGLFGGTWHVTQSCVPPPGCFTCQILLPP